MLHTAVAYMNMSISKAAQIASVVSSSSSASKHIVAQQKLGRSVFGQFFEIRRDANFEGDGTYVVCNDIVTFVGLVCFSIMVFQSLKCESSKSVLMEVRTV